MACLIKGLLDRSIYVSVFSIAFLVITYAGPLGIKKLLSAWMILFIALLVSIGLSLLFKRSVKPTITIQKSFDWSSGDGDAEANAQPKHRVSHQDIIEDGDNIVINQKIAGDAFHDIAFLLLIINNYSQYIISFNVFVFSNLNEWPFINN